VVNFEDPLIHDAIKPKDNLRHLKDKFHLDKLSKEESLAKLHHLIQNLNNKPGLLLLFGMISVVVLIFDLIINSRTLLIIPQFLGMEEKSVYIFSAIFLFIDMFIAILASGLFANNPLAKVRQIKIWQALLWVFCGLKLLLFLLYSQNSSNISQQIVLLLVVFILLIYAVLHFAGGGLHYTFLRCYYWILINIWYDTDETKKKYIYIINKIDSNLKMIGLDSEKIQICNQFQIERSID